MSEYSNTFHSQWEYFKYMIFKPSQPLYRYGHPDYNKKDNKGFSDILMKVGLNILIQYIILLKLVHTSTSLHYSELLLVSSELVLYFRDFFL